MLLTHDTFSVMLFISDIPSYIYMLHGNRRGTTYMCRYILHM